MAVGKSFLDQYSVFCVFGSVVGCVVVPLITQSVESLIFSAIVISLTANRFSKKVVIEPSVKNESKEQKSIKGSKDIIPVCKKKKKPPSNNNTNTTVQNVLYHQLSPSQLRKQYQEEAERREYEKLRELERREEEKREKKLKKKEERLKRKNSEKKEIEVKQSVPKEKVSCTADKIIATTPRSALCSPKAEPRVCTTPRNNMNTRASKYDHYRPNIPRFARQAAKQRQLQQAHNWNARPDIQPKVQSVIGCRKSPEPRSPSPVSWAEEEHETAGCYTLFGESQETKNLVSLIRTQAGLENSCP